MVQAEMIEAMEFYEYSKEHNVSGVPHTSINDGLGIIVGAVPEEYLLEEIQRAV